MALMGTVSYMSPELVTGDQADERSDVYALGILIFEMLTGTRPYTGESAVAIAVQHTNSRVPAPSSLIGGISPAVDDFVLHLTEPAPEDRPADATEVLILLEHLLENPAAAEQLAEQSSADSAATEAFDTVATQAYDQNATKPYKETAKPTDIPPAPPPQPHPNVTVLPPSVMSEQAPIGAMDHRQPPSVHHSRAVTEQPRDFGNKKPHEPVREFAPIAASRAAINTLLIVMVAAATILLGRWMGLSLMSWLFG